MFFWGGVGQLKNLLFGCSESRCFYVKKNGYGQNNGWSLIHSLPIILG